MHEMGLMDAVIKMVDDIMEKDNLTQVNKITLEVGDLSGAVPKFLYDCWDAVTDGTHFENTELQVDTVSATAWCDDCKKSFTVDVNSLCCPKCGGHKLIPLTGTDLTIKEILAV